MTEQKRLGIRLTLKHGVYEASPLTDIPAASLPVNKTPTRTSSTYTTPCSRPQDLFANTCQVCKSVYKSRGSKTKCMRRHQGPITCPHCNTKFTQQWSLKRHLKKTCKRKPATDLCAKPENPEKDGNTSARAVELNSNTQEKDFDNETGSEPDSATDSESDSETDSDTDSETDSETDSDETSSDEAPSA